MVENTPIHSLDLSIVIPVHNEQEIIRHAVVSLREGLAEYDWRYEIILAENGSVDGTTDCIAQLIDEFDDISSISLPEANYGQALRLGIEKARGRYVVCDEIDLLNLDFYKRAISRLQQGKCDFVVGSKVMGGACDRRPVMRRVATRVINGLLRAATGFQGTDTHGLKAFDRVRVLPVVHQCVVDKDLFASELVIRTHRTGRVVHEIPVDSWEKRRPAIHLFRRVPRVLSDLAQLAIALRTDGSR